MSQISYLSEVFKIIEGASRLDSVKVKNYADLLADKLDADGEGSSAKRLRKLLNSPGKEFRPAFMEQKKAIPVDSETRFPLLEIQNTEGSASSYTSMGNVASVADDFIASVEFRETLVNRGVDTASTLLLYGPPGCGKTHLAFSVAERLGLPLYVARLDGIISSYLGSTAKNLRAIFEFAAKTPCILFLDEFDALAKIRDDNQELGELKRVVNSFIQTLDKYRNELILIAATNHEQLLDSAIWRRFAYVLQLNHPQAEQRQILWRTFARDLNWSDKDLEILTDLSDGFSSSAIKEVSDRLMQNLITRGEQQNLRDGLHVLYSRGQRNASVEPALTLEKLSDPKGLYDFLHKRNSKLYTQDVTSEIVGVSRSTINRIIKTTPKKKTNKARKIKGAK